MKKTTMVFGLILFSIIANGQTIEKVTNINYNGDNGLNPKSLTVYNNKLYFLGTNDKYINKLMMTDGTLTGTVVVKQIDTAKKYAFVKGLTVYNGLLVFQNNYIGELWKSDGTSGGTSMIKTIATTTPFVAMGSKLYFGGNTVFGNPFVDQLWQTDATTNGTTLLKTINPTGPAGISSLFAFNGKLYFGATNGTDNKQLWISDGTDGGTSMLKKINPTGSADPRNFTAFNGKVYFSANNGSGAQLWVSDGTPSGTMKLTSFDVISPKEFIEYNGKLYFNAINTGSFYQLWCTDGTPEGTVMVKTNHDPINGTRGFNPTSMAVHKNKLYMSAYDSITGSKQLWVSDGTKSGTSRVTDFKYVLFPTFITSFKSLLVMKGQDSITKVDQIWVSDGTKSGTVCPKQPAGSSSAPLYPLEGFVPYNNALYFTAAYQYFADYQLCRYLDPSAGISNITSAPFVVYPNPADDFVEIRTDKKMQNVVLTDAIGKEVREVNCEMGQSISLNDLAPGIYFLRGTDQDGVSYVAKIVKKNGTH